MPSWMPWRCSTGTASTRRASRYAQEVLSRLKAKGHGQVLNRGELLSGATDIEYFAPCSFRLEPDLLVTVLGGLVYSGDIVLAITGDKIDSGKLTLLAERLSDELKAFKHVEAPKEINVAVLRALFELLGLSPGLAQTGHARAPKSRSSSCSRPSASWSAACSPPAPTCRAASAFWGQPLLRDDELRDWRTRLEALKTFTGGPVALQHRRQAQEPAHRV